MLESARITRPKIQIYIVKTLCKDDSFVALPMTRREPRELTLSLVLLIFVIEIVSNKIFDLDISLLGFLI